VEFFGYKRRRLYGREPGQERVSRPCRRRNAFSGRVGRTEPEYAGQVAARFSRARYIPVGGHEIRNVNIRFIAATNRNLQGSASKQDTCGRILFYRFTYLTRPNSSAAQSQRGSPLWSTFHRVNSRKAVNSAPDRQDHGSDPDHDWPGNVRELQMFCVAISPAFFYAGNLRDGRTNAEAPVTKSLTGVETEAIDPPLNIMKRRLLKTV